MLPFDIVTVTFTLELDMLDLQLRSIERFVPMNLVSHLFIVLNTHGESLTRLHANLVHNYLPRHPRLASKITLVNPGLLMANVDDIYTCGWRDQQVLKLLCARLVTTPLYLVLDTKHHFIRQVSGDDLSDHAGRPFVHPHNYRSGLKSFYRSLRAALRYFHIYPSEEMIVNGLPSTTPLFMVTYIVRELISNLEASGISLHRTMTNSRHVLSHVTEFHLYYAFLLSRLHTLENVYTLATETHVVTFFRSDPHSPHRIAEEISRLNESTVYMLGVHRHRYLTATHEVRDVFIKTWLIAQLFPSKIACLDFVDGMRRTMLNSEA